MARPQEYNQSYTDKAKEYLKNIGKDLPSIEGLAVFLEIHRSTVYDWKDKFVEFSDILEKLLALQAEKLMNNGLQGKWNSTITKLILTKHGYSDKTETDITSDGKPIPILSSFNALPSDHGNTEALTTDQTDTSSAGRDISQQDNLDTADTD